MELKLPENIRTLLDGRRLTRDHVGLSSAGVYLAEDMVLKIGAKEQEAHMMRWLHDKLPVPKVYTFTQEKDQNYLLMSRMPGKMLCDEAFLCQPEQLVLLLAEALRLLWSVDITSCPFTDMSRRKLALAKELVANNACSICDADPGTYSEKGFASPSALLMWLNTHCPEEHLCFSHGDFCLPNILADENGICGFVDLGFSGTADPWQDLALAYRSLRDNLAGCYGGPVRSNYPARALFDALNISIDEDKLRWYLLLDELF